MDWALAIDRNHKALLRLVTALFVVAGLVVGGAAVASMPACVRKKILRVLGPAEAATRRLIAIVARDVIVKLRAKRAGPKGPIPKGKGSGKRVPQFQLFDPRKSFPELVKSKRPSRGPGPRISGFDDDSWTPYEPKKPAQSGEPDPRILCGRLQALMRALQDIPAQARRLARLQARRRADGEPLRRTEPRRPGFPPGYRRNGMHEIDEILSDCDILVRMDPRPPDKA